MWAIRMRAAAVKARIYLEHQRTHIVFSERTLDIGTDEWNGAEPDVRIHAPKILVKKGIIHTDGDSTTEGATMSFSNLSKEQHRRMNNSSGRKYAKNHCYLRADLDDEVSNMIDIRKINAGKITIAVENQANNVEISRLPIDLADKIRDFFITMYDTKRGGCGVGFTAGALMNTGNNSKSPRGRMTTFGIFPDGTKYANTREDRKRGRMSSYDMLEDIEVLLYDCLASEYPEVLKLIQDDNEESYDGRRPPYVRKGKMIAPRIIVSSLLGNEAHIDFKDKGLSFVVWLSEKPENEVDDWRFILQSLRTDVDGCERDTTSVQLCHGIVMIYDGRFIRHATSIPDASRGNRFGVFHGSI